jgi:hypothetical protein
LFYHEEEIRNKNAKKMDATSMYTTHSKQDEDSQLHDLILVALADWPHQSSTCRTLGIVCFLILLCFFLSPPAWVVVPLRNLADAVLEGRGLYHGQWWVRVATTLFGFESQDADSSGH